MFEISRGAELKLVRIKYMYDWVFPKFQAWVFLHVRTSHKSHKFPHAHPREFVQLRCGWHDVVANNHREFVAKIFHLGASFVDLRIPDAAHRDEHHCARLPNCWLQRCDAIGHVHAVGHITIAFGDVFPCSRGNAIFFQTSLAPFYIIVAVVATEIHVIAMGPWRAATSPGFAIVRDWNFGIKLC